MRATLSQVKEWKFFSSSLLLVYEGLIESEESGSSSVGSSPNSDDMETSNVTSPPGSPSISPSLSSSAEAAISPLLGSLAAMSPAFLNQTLSSVNEHYQSSSSFSLHCSLSSLQQSVASQHHSFTLPSSSQPTAPKSSKQLFVASPSTLLSSNPPPSSSLHSSPLLTKLYTKRRKTTHAQAKERSRERGNVDVRMIDFAHTARVNSTDTNGNGDVIDSEEEEGLLFGFDTLITAIANIMDEELERRGSMRMKNKEKEKVGDDMQE